MELLIAKYQELIDSNWISYHNIWYDNLEKGRTLNISINGTNIKWYIHTIPSWDRWMQIDWSPYWNWFELLYTGNLWVLYFNRDNDKPTDKFFITVVDRVEADIKKKNKEEQEENQKMLEIKRIQEEEEENQRTDKICMDEYKKLCWYKNTHEFDEQFQILSEIEQLGKDQTNLLATWKKNIEIIAEKRTQFYSIK